MNRSYKKKKKGNLKTFSIIFIVSLGLGFLLNITKDLNSNCTKNCSLAAKEADQLFKNNQFVKALKRIDKTDVECHCSAYTQAEEPREVSLARISLSTLLRENRVHEMKKTLSKAKGPILKTLEKKYLETGNIFAE